MQNLVGTIIVLISIGQHHTNLNKFQRNVISKYKDHLKMVRYKLAKSEQSVPMCNRNSGIQQNSE